MAELEKVLTETRKKLSTRTR